MKIRQLCVLGGTGFVGGHLVTRLANSGYAVNVLTRHRERHKALSVLPDLALTEADVHDPETLRAQFHGADAVINLIGILNGSEAQFQAVHVALANKVIQACRQAEVRRLLHMSSLNADAEQGLSLYLRSKGAGEDAVHRAEGLRVTSFRPSVIFGPGDHFFSRFATLLRLSPILPLACPDARFAPVYVLDVVHAFELALSREATFGARLELCGPHSYTLRELVEFTARTLGRKCWIVRLPDGLARLQARVFEHLPGQPFTLDNYRSLQVDSVCRSDGLATLGISPHSVEAIVPLQLRGRRYRYGVYRRTSRHE